MATSADDPVRALRSARVFIAPGCLVAIGVFALCAVLTYRGTTFTALASHAQADLSAARMLSGVIDGGAVVAVLFGAARRSLGAAKANLEFAVGAALLLFSMAMQVTEARMHGAHAAGQVVAAAPPATGLAVLEMIRRMTTLYAQLRKAAQDQQDKVAAAEVKRTERTAAKAAQPATAARPAAATARGGRSDEAGLPTVRDFTTREERLERLLAEHGQLTGPLVARELAVSEGHARKIVQRHLDARATA